LAWEGEFIRFISENLKTLVCFKLWCRFSVCGYFFYETKTIWFKVPLLFTLIATLNVIRRALSAMPCK